MACVASGYRANRSVAVPRVNNEIPTTNKTEIQSNHSRTSNSSTLLCTHTQTQTDTHATQATPICLYFFFRCCRMIYHFD